MRELAIPLLLAVAAAPAARAQEADPDPAPVTDPDLPPKPPQPESDAFDWLQMNNGEWLKGELKELQDDTVVFESDEFDELELDLDDVHSLSVPRGAEVLLEEGGFRFDYLRVRDRSDRPTVSGPLRIEGDTVTVQTEEGLVTLSRDEVRSIVGQRRSELDYWSGKLSLGATLTRGNVDRDDVSGFARIERRDNLTRLRIGYDGAYSVADGRETADNHRFTTTYDYYATQRVFLRPFDLEVFRDRFQNIAYRVTPGAGAGYTLIDDSRTDWTVSAGAGYRYTEFIDAAPGEAGSSESAVVSFGTIWNWEATGDIDVGAEFDCTVPVPENNDYTLRAKAYTAIELWSDFDLDLQVIWDRVNDPSPDADGTAPDSDEFRFYAGVGWEF